MNHIENANLAGVTLADLDWLLRGQASANVADRLGVTMAEVEDFIQDTPPSRSRRALWKVKCSYSTSRNGCQ